MIKLFRSVLILDSQSSFYNQKVDILMEDNLLLDIGVQLKKPEGSIEVNQNAYAFVPGLVDLRVHNTLPGGEHRENWDTLAQAAINGGVFTLQLLPTGTPVPQTSESIKYIRSVGEKFGLSFQPMAPLTIDNKGENFADLIDLASAGSRGFSHGDSSLQNTDLFAKCLQYLMTQPVKVYTQPNSSSLSLYGQIHEGLQSTLTGLKGIPTLSETLSIKRDLDLLEYVINHSFGNLNPEFGLHFYCISSKESVKLISQAKSKGLPVTCSVAAHQLIFNEDAIADFDTNFKVQPPFRSEEDRKALVAGVLSGDIDAIVSDHNPVEVELKEVEFDHAAFGVIGLQTLLQASLEAFDSDKYDQIIKALVDNPSAILGITQKTGLLKGEKVSGTMIELGSSSTFTQEKLVSLSKNSPFIGYTFKTKIEQVFH